MKIEGENRSILVLCGIITIMIFMGIFSAGCIGDDDRSDGEIKITTSITEKGDTGWVITIEDVKGELKLEDVMFRFTSTSHLSLPQKRIDDSNPPSIIRDASTIYAVPSQHGTPVRDNTTGLTIKDGSYPKNYELAYLTYVDSNSDAKVSKGDLLWVYKDYNSDGTLDFHGNGEFGIEFRTGDNKVVGSQEL